MTSPLTAWYDALAAGDLATAAQSLTEDTVLHVPGRSSNTGTGEWGVALCTYTATRPDRDQPLENNLAHVARLRDGRIAESWLHSRDQYAVDEFWGDPVAVSSPA